jgi:hypothetical protein
MPRKETYRGYEVAPNDKGSMVIRKDGKIIGTQSCTDFAFDWIDIQIDKEEKEQTK